jgi:cold shock CspA family protein
MKVGTIKCFYRQLAFGFLKPDDGAEDLFFDPSSVDGNLLAEDLCSGFRVTFELGSRDGRPCAVNIKLAAAGYA